MGAVSRAWKRYRGRKTRIGIVIDFAFLFAVLILAIAPLRRGVMTYILRCAASQPDIYEQIVFVGANDSILATTATGADTTLRFPPGRPTLINTASVWSAQSRAELRSLNIAAERWTGIDFYMLVSADEAEDMTKYMRRKRYTGLHMLIVRDNEDDEAEIFDDGVEEPSTGLVADMRNSIPATLLIDRDGKVIIKKLGAAKWTGRRIEEAYRLAIDN